jgi:hypothetical protein
MSTDSLHRPARARAAAFQAERDGAFSILPDHPLMAAVLLPSGGFGLRAGAGRRCRWPCRRL